MTAHSTAIKIFAVILPLVAYVWIGKSLRGLGITGVAFLLGFGLRILQILLGSDSSPLAVITIWLAANIVFRLWVFRDVSKILSQQTPDNNPQKGFRWSWKA